MLDFKLFRICLLAVVSLIALTAQAADPAAQAAAEKEALAEKAVAAKDLAEKAAAAKELAGKATAAKDLAAKALAEKAALEKTLAEKVAAEMTLIKKAAPGKALAAKATAAKVIAEKALATKSATAKTLSERAAAEEALAKKAATAKAAAAKTLVEKTAAEKAQAAKAAAAKTLADKAVAEKTAAEKAVAAKALAEKTAAAQALTAKAAAEKATAEKAATAKALTEKAVAAAKLAERTLAERTLAEKTLAEKTAAAKTLAEKAATEMAAAAKAVTEKAAAAKTLAAKDTAQTAATQKATTAKALAVKADAAKKLAEKTLATKVAAEKPLLAKSAKAQSLVAKATDAKILVEKSLAMKTAALKALEEKAAAEKTLSEKAAAEKTLAEKVLAEKTDIALTFADPLRKIVDDQIRAALKKTKTPSAKVSSDAEFVRRLYLDLTGSIPSATQTQTFLADQAADKREKLIDALLASDAYARHMAESLDVMLMERRPDKYVTTAEWQAYLADSFAKNKPLDVLMREILSSDGTVPELRPAAKFFLDRAVDKDVLVRDIGRLLLGMDMQCAQCHDHPDIDDYLHYHYHGLSVFVAGSKIFKQPDGKMGLQETAMREVEFVSVFDPDTTKKTGPRLLEALMEVPELVEGEEYIEKPARDVRAVPKFSLRKLLAERLPSSETPEFARNMANRLWAKMMGRGIVHPLDMHHTNNPPSHPELLHLLSERLNETRFDTKAFLREMALSATYQQSSEAPEGVDIEQFPPESYAVALMKGLSPEQLFHSVQRATGSEKLLEEQIEAKLKEDADKYKELSADPMKFTEARAKGKADRIKEFVTLFGSPTGTPEGEFQAAITQALFLANSETVISWLEPGADNLTERLLKIEDPAQVVKESYLAILSRQPEPEESKLALEHLTAHKESQRQAVIQLVWSLLASAEFRLNH